MTPNVKVTSRRVTTESGHLRGLFADPDQADIERARAVEALLAIISPEQFLRASGTWEALFGGSDHASH